MILHRKVKVFERITLTVVSSFNFLLVVRPFHFHFLILNLELKNVKRN